MGIGSSNTRSLTKSGSIWRSKSWARDPNEIATSLSARFHRMPKGVADAYSTHCQRDQDRDEALTLTDGKHRLTDDRSEGLGVGPPPSSRGRRLASSSRDSPCLHRSVVGVDQAIHLPDKSDRQALGTAQSGSRLPVEDHAQSERSCTGYDASDACVVGGGAGMEIALLVKHHDGARHHHIRPNKMSKSSAQSALASRMSPVASTSPMKWPASLPPFAHDANALHASAGDAVASTSVVAVNSAGARRRARAVDTIVALTDALHPRDVQASTGEVVREILFQLRITLARWAGHVGLLLGRFCDAAQPRQKTFVPLAAVAGNLSSHRR